jgi:hypothetical protein
LIISNEIFINLILLYTIMEKNNDEKVKNKYVKRKTLQRMANSVACIMPNKWIKELGWDKDTKLIVTFNPAEGEIIIKKDPDQSEKPEDEEVSSVVIE